ncbi:MAG TPA: DUF2381 family protein [Archangium sp.]|uniref:DUF2381 family protein n=1 Tax=Archangium sp. TaxID=1872627 RepID=UPI002E37FDAF|nr:DUF2381 family protein [Archangium sp.]HEX5747488.1 DUF2381 family protein [Archangium sp.]
MPVPCSTTVLLLLLLHPGLPTPAQPAMASWDMSGAPRFTVTADTAGEAREVLISPHRALALLFNMPVRSGGVVVEERERFLQVSLSEDGRMLNLLPSDELKTGQRLRLTVRFADGATPTSADFTLVVSPRAEAQVEVYRELRPCDSYRQQAEETEAKHQQCQTQLARERAEREAPRGIIGLLVLRQMGEEGIRSKVITEEVTPRPGEAFHVEHAVSYRATGGEKESEVTRLAVELRLWNEGSKPWTPTHAQLVGEGARWDLAVWVPGPLGPGKEDRVLVEGERPGRAASGPYVLELWDAGMTRTVTLSGVTFP